MVMLSRALLFEPEPEGAAMKHQSDESVGSEFRLEDLQFAQAMSLTVVTEAAKHVRSGMTEKEAREIVTQIQTQAGAPKCWHPPQIRFGENTILPFGEKGIEDIKLKSDDIFFFDIGPIFQGHEGDVGRPFTLGHDPEMQKCCRDAETIWHEVHRHWNQTQESGQQLYHFAEQCAQQRGWLLNLKKANGHRIADFPHAAKIRGSIEGLSHTPAANRWILEIQIRHPQRRFGAFFEDLLA